MSILWEKTNMKETTLEDWHMARDILDMDWYLPGADDNRLAREEPPLEWIPDFVGDRTFWARRSQSGLVPEKKLKRGEHRNPHPFRTINGAYRAKGKQV
jgi:hypothetical protein